MMITTRKPFLESKDVTKRKIYLIRKYVQSSQDLPLLFIRLSTEAIL